MEPRPVEPRHPQPLTAGEKAAEVETTVAVSAAAIERLRSSMPRPAEVVPLSPTASARQTAEASSPDVMDGAIDQSGAEQVVPSSSASSGEGKGARLEFLFRPRAPRRAPQESFESMWPKRAAQGVNSQPKVLATVGPSTAEAIQTAVINKRAGGTGLISGRKAFQKPFKEGAALLQAIQDVYLCKDVTIA